jgi:hypothetical protein
MQSPFVFSQYTQHTSLLPPVMNKDRLWWYSEGNVPEVCVFIHGLSRRSAMPMQQGIDRIEVYKDWYTIIMANTLSTLFAPTAARISVPDRAIGFPLWLDTIFLGDYSFTASMYKLGNG